MRRFTFPFSLVLTLALVSGSHVLAQSYFSDDMGMSWHDDYDDVGMDSWDTEVGDDDYAGYENDGFGLDGGISDDDFESDDFGSYDGDFDWSTDDDEFDSWYGHSDEIF